MAIRNRLAIAITMCKIPFMHLGAISKYCDYEDWESEYFKEIASKIMNCNVQAVPIHRKLWEFVLGTLYLDSLGLWNEDAIGLSVAGGTERFLFFAANHIKRMVSADIYGTGNFASEEATLNFYKDPVRFAPYPYRKDHLHVVNSNACDLRFPDGVFDFVVCFSSIEHFGGVLKATQALKEMHRVVKPGGAVFLTTDCTINGVVTNEVFHAHQLEEIVRSSGLKMDVSIDCSLSDSTKKFVTDMRTGNLQQLPHLNLKLYRSVFTSVSLALRRVEDGPSSPTSSDTIDAWCKHLRDTNVLVRESSFQAKYRHVTNQLRSVRYKIEEKLLRQPTIK